ncbi:hypothetical protein FB451DRAFT_1169415 [Mycena latifolia]|nr:hypothetical protein FB451DRAFT_1169415 [Mycena latifolia]
MQFSLPFNKRSKGVIVGVTTTATKRGVEAGLATTPMGFQAVDACRRPCVASVRKAEGSINPDQIMILIRAGRHAFVFLFFVGAVGNAELESDSHHAPARIRLPNQKLSGRRRRISKDPQGPTRVAGPLKFFTNAWPEFGDFGHSREGGKEEEKRWHPGGVLGLPVTKYFPSPHINIHISNRVLTAKGKSVFEHQVRIFVNIRLHQKPTPLGGVKRGSIEVSKLKQGYQEVGYFEGLILRARVKWGNGCEAAFCDRGGGSLCRLNE